MSSRTGSESTGDSTGVGRMVAHFLVPGFDDWDAARQQELALAIDGPIRKTAHGIEYAILSALVLGITWTGSLSGFVNAFIFTALYAASDEIHQLFVPGRSGMIKDVCIDSFGALIFLGLFMIITKYPIKQKEETDR